MNVLTFLLHTRVWKQGTASESVRTLTPILAKVGNLINKEFCQSGHAMLSVEENQLWPTNGQIGYITPAVWGFPKASKRGTKSAMAHKRAAWLHNPYHVGGPQCFIAGEKMSSGPQMGRLATQPVPSRGSPKLQSGEEFFCFLAQNTNLY